MSLLNANCDAPKSKHNHHNQNYGTMSTLVDALDQTRGVLQTILYQLTPTTSRINPKDGTDRMTLSAAPLQLRENAIIQCPCLSLHADLDSTMMGTQHHSHSHHSNDRTQAKDHAIKLLSRPMTYVHCHPPLPGNTNPKMTPSTPSAIIAVIGRTVQQHVFASFAVLVDRRLNAYTDVLTRHASVLSSMYQHHHHQHEEEEKANPVPRVIDGPEGRPGTATSTSLSSVQHHHDNTPNDVEEEEDVVNSKMLVLNEKKWMIQNKGIQTEAHALTSQFQLLPSPPFTTMILVPEETTTSVSPTTPLVVISAPIRYSMTMELHIPVGHDNHGTKKIVPVSFSTDGFIKCAYSQGDDFVLKSIKINLNTKDLLDKMVQETTRAVSIIVDVVNSLCLQQHHSNDKKRSLLPRSVSYLAMPPPPPIVNRVQHHHHQEVGKITSHTHYRRSILDGTSNNTITDTTGLDLLCNAVVTDSVPVVSPQLSNTPSPNHHITVDLSLENDDAERTNQKIDEDVSRLSLDQCADIVDVCLFGESFDTNHYDLDYVSTPPPSSKRIKIEQ